MGTTQHKAAYEHPQHLVATSSSMPASCPRRSSEFTSAGPPLIGFATMLRRGSGAESKADPLRKSVLTIDELASIRARKRPGSASMTS